MTGRGRTPPAARDSALGRLFPARAVDATRIASDELIVGFRFQDGVQEPACLGNHGDFRLAAEPLPDPIHDQVDELFDGRKRQVGSVAEDRMAGSRQTDQACCRRWKSAGQFF